MFCELCDGPSVGERSVIEMGPNKKLEKGDKEKMGKEPDCLEQMRMNTKNWLSGQGSRESEISSDQDVSSFKWEEYEPKTRIFTKAEKSYVRDALVDLPHRERIVVELMYWKGLSANEAGKVLKLRADEVKNVEKRALRNLRKMYMQDFSQYSKRYEQNQKFKAFRENQDFSGAA